MAWHVNMPVQAISRNAPLGLVYWYRASLYHSMKAPGSSLTYSKYSTVKARLLRNKNTAPYNTACTGVLHLMHCLLPDITLQSETLRPSAIPEGSPAPQLAPAPSPLPNRSQVWRQACEQSARQCYSADAI